MMISPGVFWLFALVAFTAGGAGCAMVFYLLILPRYERFVQRVSSDMAEHLTQRREPDTGEILISDVAAGPRHALHEQRRTFVMGKLPDPSS